MYEHQRSLLLSICSEKHRSQVESFHKGEVMRIFDFYFMVFERTVDVLVMLDALVLKTHDWIA